MSDGIIFIGSIFFFLLGVTNSNLISTMVFFNIGLLLIIVGFVEIQRERDVKKQNGS